MNLYLGRRDVVRATRGEALSLSIFFGASARTGTGSADCFATHTQRRAATNDPPNHPPSPVCLWLHVFAGEVLA